MKVLIKKTSKLNGIVKISGSKNSTLPLLALSLLTNKRIVLTNVPLIDDVFNMLTILRKIGIKVQIDKLKHEVSLKRKKINSNLLFEEINKIRASYYVLPGVISKSNKTHFIMPGGCKFSKRPIDFHLKIFKSAGVNINKNDDLLIFTKTKLNPFSISFDKPSVGATINAIMLATLIKGKSIIYNQPLEPEIIDVVNCLKKMGAKIFISDKSIIVYGKKKLTSVKYKVMPDRIELGSYALLGSVTRSNITMSNINKISYEYILPYFKRLNIDVYYNKDKLTICGKNILKSGEYNIDVYPNFPTDLQPILSTCLLRANEKSIIIDKVYPNRISHIEQLKKLGAKIDYKDGKILITPSTLYKGNVVAHDLRCGFALIIAAIITNDDVCIDNFDVVYRGYENIFKKLKAIGVSLEPMN